MTTSKREKIHLVKEGDSLGLIPVKFACEDETEGAMGYLEVEKVTCWKCLRSDLYKELCKEVGIEPYEPWKEAAKKAWETRRANRKTHQARMRAIVEEINEMKPEDRTKIKNAVKI